MSSCKDCVHYEVCEDKLFKNTDNACKKHFIAKSRFVELPCEVGQTVYFIPFGNYIAESTVAEITVVPFKEIGFSILCHGGFVFELRGFGKTVYLSREEAEKALKERANE